MCYLSIQYVTTAYLTVETKYLLKRPQMLKGAWPYEVPVWLLGYLLKWLKVQRNRALGSQKRLSGPGMSTKCLSIAARSAESHSGDASYRPVFMLDARWVRKGVFKPSWVLRCSTKGEWGQGVQPCNFWCSFRRSPLNDPGGDPVVMVVLLLCNKLQHLSLQLKVRHKDCHLE